MRINQIKNEETISLSYLKNMLAENTKILIADDDEAMRILLRDAITQWGYEVIEAKDGEEAWGIMKKSDAPRLIILDWRMPRMDGITLCELIRQNLAFYPYIIFLSQVSGASSIMRGLDAGADEFLLKPVNFEELRTRIFAGERIIKFIKKNEEQKLKLENCILYSRLLEQLIILLSDKHEETKN